jgi:hypothetical protein
MDPRKSQTFTATPAKPGELLKLFRDDRNGSRHELVKAALLHLQNPPRSEDYDYETPLSK